MFVRTERLFLRPCWPEDLDDLLDVFREKTIQRMFVCPSLPETREEIHKYLNQPRNPRLPHFVMYLRGLSGARLVGGIGLDMDGERVLVGCWIAGDHRGKGYVLEALRAVVEQARVLGHRQLFTSHSDDNDHASIRILEAAGFRADGEQDAQELVRLYVADLVNRGSLSPASTDTALSA